MKSTALAPPAARGLTAQIQRIAIINRGEAALRLISAVRELNQERGTRIITIALFTEPERHALFVREADEAVALGPAMLPTGGAAAAHSAYADLDVLEGALAEARADAAWAGWGFAAEDPAFAELCRRAGVLLVGPGPEILRLLSDPVALELIASDCAMPLHAGSGDTEAVTARHLEVQVIADAGGTVWVLGVRDSSIRHRGEKMLEESACPALTAAEQQQVEEGARRVCERSGYRGVGTVQFLFEPANRRISLLGMTPDLQAGHPVTEMTTGADLVKLQLHIAQGGLLEGTQPPARGHAIGIRLCAEDPDDEFTPSPGRVAVFSPPSGPGVRVDTGVVQGDVIAGDFDPVMAKIVAWGRDRGEALARLHRALVETTVVVEAGATNRAFLLELVQRPEVVDGSAGIGWLDHADRSSSWPRPHAELALAIAAVEVDQAELAIDQARFLASASRGRPAVRAAVGRTIDLQMHGYRQRLHVKRLGPTTAWVELDGRTIELETERLGAFERRVRWHGETYHVLCVEHGGRYLVEIDGVQHRASRNDDGVVRAPFPAVVVAVRVAVGDTVAPGDVIAVLEAMKLEMPLVAPFAGTVSRVLVQSNVQVGAGEPLLRVEAVGDGAATAIRRGEPLSLPEATSSDEEPQDRCRRSLAVLRRLMLGYDVDLPTATAALAEYSRGCALGHTVEDGLRSLENEVLSTFADVCALSRRQPDATTDIAGPGRSDQEWLHAYLGTFDAESLPAAFTDSLKRALAHYGVTTLTRTPELEDRLYWLVRAQQRADAQIPAVLSLLDHLEEHAGDLSPAATDELRVILDRVHTAARHRHPAIADLAREVRFRYFDHPLMERARELVYDEARQHIEHLELNPDTDRADHIRALVGCPQPMHNLLTSRFPEASPQLSAVMLEVLTRRYYRTRELDELDIIDVDGRPAAVADYVHHNVPIRAVTTFALVGQLTPRLRALRRLVVDAPDGAEAVIDAYIWRWDPAQRDDELAMHLRGEIAAATLPATVHRIVVMVTEPRLGLGMSSAQHFTFRRHGTGFREDRLFRGLHPMVAQRLQLGRLRNFTIERLPSAEDVYAFRGVARANPRDERLVVMAEVRDVTPVRDADGRVARLPSLERMLAEALADIRRFQSHRTSEQRLQWNRVTLYVLPPLELELSEVRAIAERLAPDTEDLGLDRIDVEVSMRDGRGILRPLVLHLTHPAGAEAIVLRVTKPSKRPLLPLDEYTQKVVSMRRRGLTYPYEIVGALAPTADGTSGGFPPGDFVEYDLDATGSFVPVDRPAGHNIANLVAGVIRNFTPTHPEGMARVILLGDPSRSLGALAEPECRRIIAALDLAERMLVPLEWFTLSSGARIAMDSGTENMDWIARVLRRIIDFTQAGGEVNLVVDAINVGAQPYWNAEATMLMHTRGILIMTPQGAMVLTGKQALEYSGSVSAEDNFGIGGYGRIMGPNGQAQYWASDLVAACSILLRHYEHTYRAPGERFPRRTVTADPYDRDVRDAPHPQRSSGDFAHVGDIFSAELNPGRKKPFDIRAVMGAVIDQDHRPLERWTDMEDAANAVVWDAHLGGYPVCLIGMESHPLIRHGFIPADGPDHWTPGTLFPQSSKKIARAVNSATGNRPLVVLANLSGFDGSPESMRRVQLEFGAEIGRAVVNFRGPMVFCVVSRYHGGAFVVFSATLNEHLEVAAVEGSFASVIGGAPAAAVVFTREVEKRTRADPRVVELAAAIEAASGSEKAPLRARMAAMLEQARREKLGEVAAEFDSIHTVQRARRMGSVHRIITASTLRPYLIDAVERGVLRELAALEVDVAGRIAMQRADPAPAP